MSVDHFTPVSGAIGGALIGIAATALLATHGRVAGISGMVARLLTGGVGDRAWRAAFLVGLLVGAALCFALVPSADAFVVTGDVATLVVAGLCVGFGARLGGGCTSGHGVCGLAAGSRRSLAATLTFMAAGFATVWLVRHVVGAGA